MDSDSQSIKSTSSSSDEFFEDVPLKEARSHEVETTSEENKVGIVEGVSKEVKEQESEEESEEQETKEVDEENDESSCSQHLLKRKHEKTSDNEDCELETSAPFINTKLLALPIEKRKCGLHGKIELIIYKSIL
jgi:hypothetical protein